MDKDVVNQELTELSNKAVANLNELARSLDTLGAYMPEGLTEEEQAQVAMEAQNRLVYICKMFGVRYGGLLFA